MCDGYTIPPALLFMWKALEWHEVPPINSCLQDKSNVTYDIKLDLRICEQCLIFGLSTKSIASCNIPPESNSITSWKDSEQFK
ncbi:hypothetical protein Cantr_04812 [Candida viswanathii]|uniref:Uncharacterized protein n=1 Tax=Candida viswanathii TaxID=5486 RepID=A0A367XQH6_9ASCO|nr:hypothetical protein Cantr_04812 [Candida viswanathii]